jgi:hypothetical protein
VTRAASTAQTRASPRPPVAPVIGLCHRWVLIGLFEGRTNDFLRVALAGYCLPCPSDADLDELRTHFVPKGFRLKSPKNAPLFEELGIAQFIQETPRAQEALALLQQPRARELIEAGQILSVPPSAIARAILKYLKFGVTLEALALYTDIFFEVGAVARSQLRTLVHERVRLAVTRFADPQDEAVLQRAILSDPRSVALSLCSSASAWASVLMAAGHAPPRYELVNVIEQMETLATLRTNEALLRGEPGDERRAESFVGVLTKVHELKEKVVTPEAQLAKSLATFQLRTSNERMKTIAELCGDRHTVDVGPPLAEPDGT